MNTERDQIAARIRAYSAAVSRMMFHIRTVANFYSDKEPGEGDCNCLMCGPRMQAPEGFLHTLEIVNECLDESGELVYSVGGYFTAAWVELNRGRDRLRLARCGPRTGPNYHAAASGAVLNSFWPLIALPEHLGGDWDYGEEGEYEIAIPTLEQLEEHREAFTNSARNIVRFDHERALAFLDIEEAQALMLIDKLPPMPVSESEHGANNYLQICGDVTPQLRAFVEQINNRKEDETKTDIAKKIASNHKSLMASLRRKVAEGAIRKTSRD